MEVAYAKVSHRLFTLYLLCICFFVFMDTSSNATNTRGHTNHAKKGNKRLQLQKANFEIKTPTVTIGVRGTTLNIVVDRTGATATQLATASNVDVSNGWGDVVALDQPNTVIFDRGQ